MPTFPAPRPSDKARCSSKVLTKRQSGDIMGKDRTLWMVVRRALIMVLGAIEDYLDLERTRSRSTKK